MSPAPRHPTALSVDVEDWFHPLLVRPAVPAGEARSVVSSGTGAILDLLHRHGARATFFVLGEVAAQHPDLVRRIADEGHEIACHGMTHRPLWALTPETFREELRSCRAAVTAALGQDPALGFRASTFSLDQSTAWALDVLHEEGFRYDSSVFPLRVSMYGVPRAPLGIYRPAADDLARHDPGRPLVEFPVAVGALGPLRLPVGGGFYVRALPLAALTAVLDGITRRCPSVLYLHPWECVPQLPRVRLSPLDSFVTYAGLGTFMAKLDRLLDRYRSTTVREILEQYGHLAPRTPQEN